MSVHHTWRQPEIRAYALSFDAHRIYSGASGGYSMLCDHGLLPCRRRQFVHYRPHYRSRNLGGQHGCSNDRHRTPEWIKVRDRLSGERPEQPLCHRPEYGGGDIEGVHGRVPKCAAVWLRWDALRRWWRPWMRTGGAPTAATVYTDDQHDHWSGNLVGLKEFMIPPATLSSITAFTLLASTMHRLTNCSRWMNYGRRNACGGHWFLRTYSVLRMPEAGTLYGFNDIGNNVISINTAERRRDIDCKPPSRLRSWEPRRTLCPASSAGA